jgi:hypothetical protein
VTDSSGGGDAFAWVQVERLGGDGYTADSVMANGVGVATVSYQFNGDFGHTQLRLYGTHTTDTVELQVRASTIIAGAEAQGQYVLLGDTYADVKHYNGLPQLTVPDDSYWLNYAVYETALGLVLVVVDENQSNSVDDGEHVNEIVLNTVYAGKSKDSLGVGSTIQAFRAVYGTETETWVDATPPAADAYRFGVAGVVVFTYQGQNEVFEIHLYDPTPGKAVRLDRSTVSGIAADGFPVSRWTK